MTPAQLDHLSRIKRHLETLLSDAGKRTPGEWKLIQPNIDKGEFIWSVNAGTTPVCPALLNNASFIASCAGNAEAGWRSTLAAIEVVMQCHDNWHEGRFIGNHNLFQSILADWPIEKLP